MSGLSGLFSNDLPQLFDSSEIEILQHTREAQRSAIPAEVPHPWPVVEAQFPRIARAIFDLWGTPQCDAYLSSLVIDDRGEREGFPPHVLRALLDLSRQHERQFRFVNAQPCWVDSPLSPQRCW